MKSICVIPARMGSSRFPGKPLEKVLEIPLIIHVAKRCLLSSRLDDVYVATCDREIEEVCQMYGVQTIMTSSSHERCTDRVSEAISKLHYKLNKDDLVLMVQGDEIMVEPAMVDKVIARYDDSKAPVINLLSSIKTPQDHEDPNVVKVVFSVNNKALYFSRAPVPSTYRDPKILAYQQTGVIGFSSIFLDQYSKMPQTPLEKVESIDMLRVLENDLPLEIVTTDKETVAVDMPYDIKRAEEMMMQDPFLKTYANIS